MTDEDGLLSHARLDALVQQKRWNEIIALTSQLTEQEALHPGYFFFRATALIELGQSSEAIRVIHHGLSVSPTSSWGNRLLFDAYRANNQISEAFGRFSQYINSSGNHEREKAWFVECAAELDLFDLAAEMNLKRAVIRDVPKSPHFALGVQCFCKADTLEEVFSNLMKLDDCSRFGLVILQDGNIDSLRPERYESGYQNVKRVIEKWHPLLMSKFYSVECLENKQNCGTAPTCRRLLDHISLKYTGFLFIEDDCVLAQGALDWCEYHLQSTVSTDGNWFVTCESSYFDREERELKSATHSRLEAIAKSNSIKHSYVLLDFVPSTCFGTTSELWKHCANVRSFTRGPESLNRLAALKGFKTVAPVVPYAADIGMLHSLGYSVSNSGAQNVRERKCTYLFAEGAFERKFCGLYKGDKDLLFSATSKLDERSIEALEHQLRGGDSAR